MATQGSLYGHVKAVLIDGTVDSHSQDVDIKPSDEVAEVVTRGHADSIPPIGPPRVAITIKTQYPRGGGDVDYWDLFTTRSTFDVAWVDCDGKRGSARNCRVTSCPRSDPMKGERSQSVEIVGYLNV